MSSRPVSRMHGSLIYHHYRRTTYCFAVLQNGRGLRHSSVDRFTPSLLFPSPAQYLMPKVDFIRPPCQIPSTPIVTSNSPALLRSSPAFCRGTKLGVTGKMRNRATDSLNAVGLRIAHPQPSADHHVSQRSQCGYAFSLFQPASESRSSSPPAMFRPTNNLPARQRTVQACDNCRQRKTKVSISRLHKMLRLRLILRLVHR